MKITIVLPRVSYPLIDGARKANFQFISGLAAQNKDITVICLAGEEEKEFLEVFKEKSGIREVYFIPRLSHLTGWRKYFRLFINLFRSPFIPVTYQAYQSPSILKNLESLFTKLRPDIIIAITPHAGAAVLESHPKIPVIYRSENVEYELWEKRGREEKKWLLRTMLKFQESLVKKLELKLIQKSVHTFTISEEDKRLYLKELPESNITFIPMGLEVPPILPFQSNEVLSLFFLGKLDWGPNADGLLWFLKNVWPKVRDAKVKLIIAGSGETNKLLPFLNDPKIDFRGRVEELRSHFAEAHVVLVPVFYGSGTRIKVLEASVFGRACLSTAMGVQGSPLHQKGIDFLLAETEVEWVENIKKLNQKELEEIGKKAYVKINEELEISKVSKKTLDLIQAHLR